VASKGAEAEINNATNTLKSFSDATLVVKDAYALQVPQLNLEPWRT
jgi:hypothetical protein